MQVEVALMPMEEGIDSILALLMLLFEQGVQVES